MKTIAVINQKGGVAKTTTVHNLARYYESQNYRVLAVDLDAQGNLTLGMNGESDITILEFFKGQPVQTVSISDKLDLIPSDLRFAGIEVQIMSELNRERILSKILKPLENRYDLCIIDCPPALNLLTINALSAADYTLIPLKPSTYSYVGLGMMMDFIQKVKDNINEKLEILGIALTAFDEHKVVAKETIKKLEKDDYLKYLFNSKIRTSEKFVRAEENHQSIFEYDKDSNSAKEYAALAEEILTHIKKANHGK